MVNGFTYSFSVSFSLSPLLMRNVLWIAIAEQPNFCVTARFVNILPAYIHSVGVYVIYFRRTPPGKPARLASETKR